MSMIDAARLLVGGGDRNIAFVFAGEDRGQARYARSIRRQARLHGIDTLVRMVGHCADMPAALAAADVVVVPALEPPLAGHAAAEAQAMGRPVVASAVGVLPENLLCPPRMRDELRTGWLVRPGYLAELAQAVGAELALDITSYKALGARARQFAEFHVFAAKRCRSHSRSLYLAASSRRLTSIVSRS
jgi:glycosyltransferase involved in cell wall biosynthesis